MQVFHRFPPASPDGHGSQSSHHRASFGARRAQHSQGIVMMIRFISLPSSDDQTGGKDVRKSKGLFERKATPHALDLHPTTNVAWRQHDCLTYQHHLGSDGHLCAVRAIHWSPLGEGAPQDSVLSLYLACLVVASSGPKLAMSAPKDTHGEYVRAPHPPPPCSSVRRQVILLVTAMWQSLRRQFVHTSGSRWESEAGSGSTAACVPAVCF